MPFYEYDCGECGRFDVRQGMNDKHVAKCPTCGAKDTKRVYSKFGMSVITDAEIKQRLIGVPKKRIEKAKELRADRAKRQADPSSMVDVVSNELHTPAKKKHITRGGR